MTEREMFEQSFQRPKNFFKLSERDQWFIDKHLGILDWEGEGLTRSASRRITKADCWQIKAQPFGFDYLFYWKKNPSPFDSVRPAGGPGAGILEPTLVAL